MILRYDSSEWNLHNMLPARRALHHWPPGRHFYAKAELITIIRTSEEPRLQSRTNDTGYSSSGLPGYEAL